MAGCHDDVIELLGSLDVLFQIFRCDVEFAGLVVVGNMPNGRLEADIFFDAALFDATDNVIMKDGARRI